MAGLSSDPSDYLGQLVGSPVTITSGFRTPQKNALVGGVSNSAHLVPGQAFDFVPNGISTSEAANRIAKSGIPFDQVYDEGNHVHVSFAPTNRRQVIQPKMAQAQNVSDEDLLGALGGSQASVGAAPAGKDVSDADLLGALGGSQQPVSGGSPAASPSSPTGQPSMLESAARGVVRGVKGAIGSVVPVDAFIARTLGFPETSNRLLSNLKAFQGQEPAFQQQYGTSGQVGEALGQIGTAVPLMAAGGEALAPALAGARAAAPAIAPALDFLSGASKGNKLLQLASRGVSGAIQGGTAAAITSGASDQPINQQVGQGMELGGVLNTALPAAKMAGGALFNSLHNAAPSARTALANEAVNTYGIPLRGSQISTGAFPSYLDSAVGKLPFMGLESQNEAQRVAFTRAVAGTMGEQADNLTPKVMSSARDRIGQVFDDVASRTQIQDAPMLLKNLGDVVGEASQVLPEDSVKPLLKQVANIGGLVDQNTKTLSGQAYQVLTHKGGPLDRAMNSSDSDIRYYAGQIRKTLDDALQASASPQDLQDLKTARLQWKNMRTVQDLAAKANIEGEITPSLLLGAVKKSYKDMPFSGAGEIGKLAQIGQEFLKEKPSSSTPERMLLYRLLEGFGGAAAGGFAGLEGVQHPIAAGLGLTSLMTGSKITAAALKSKAYRNAMLSAAGHGGPTLNGVLGANGRYTIPSVIAGNRLLNAPDESASQ